MRVPAHVIYHSNLPLQKKEQKGNGRNANGMPSRKTNLREPSDVAM